jgi:hypothetical protein
MELDAGAGVGKAGSAVDMAATMEAECVERIFF